MISLLCSPIPFNVIGRFFWADSVSRDVCIWFIKKLVALWYVPMWRLHYRVMDTTLMCWTRVHVGSKNVSVQGLCWRLAPRSHSCVRAVKLTSEQLYRWDLRNDYVITYGSNKCLQLLYSTTPILENQIPILCGFLIHLLFFIISYYNKIRNTEIT